jgi:hypothetical protein
MFDNWPRHKTCLILSKILQNLALLHTMWFLCQKQLFIPLLNSYPNKLILGKP